MSQNETTVPDISSIDKKPNFFTRLRTEHPRKVKAAAITAAVLILGGAGAALAAKKSDDDSTPEVYTGTFEGTDTPSEA